MTQSTNDLNAEVATIKENVRHNERSVDRLERDLKEFRAEVTAEFKGLESSFQSRLIIGVCIIVVANVVLKYLP